MTDQEYVGQWWIADRPDCVVAGMMKFSCQDGVRLDLVGSFHEDFHHGEVIRCPLILGVTRDGTEVTLSECFETLRTLGAHPTTQNWMAELALVGAHARDEGAMRSTRAQVSYTYLPEWLGISGFAMEFERTEGAYPKSWNFRFDFPDDKAEKIAQGSVAVKCDLRQNVDWVREIRLTQEAALEFEVPQALSFSEWWPKFIRPLQNLMTLGTGRPNSVEEVALFVESVQVDDRQVSRERRVIALFANRSLRPRSEKKLFGHELLFALHDSPYTLGKTVEQWLNVAQDLDSVCNLYFGVQYQPDIFDEWAFLFLVQAAEAYHRHRYNSKVLPAEKHEARVQAVLQSAPNEYKDWLKWRLRHSNEPTLRDRLSQLLNDTKLAIMPMLADPVRFPDRVAELRNLQTHHEHGPDTKRRDGGELFDLTQALGAMLKALLLGELDVAREKIPELLGRDRRYQWQCSKRQRARKTMQAANPGDTVNDSQGSSQSNGC